MRKNFILLMLMAVAIITAGQTNNCYSLTKSDKMVNLVKKSANTQKLYGDTIYYEDFANGFPTGWQSVDLTGNGFDFVWSTVGPTGAYTGSWPNPETVHTNTAANGFMMLPSDYYNTDAGGTMVTYPIEMDCYLQTSAFDFSVYASVIVRMNVQYRTCCASSANIWMKVSTDGINWSDEYDIKTVPNNVAKFDFIEFNISDLAANQSTVYFRFGQQNSSHYYFVLDDLAFVEGPTNDIQIAKCFNNFFGGNGYFNSIPLSQANTDTINWALAIYNNGSNTATNCMFDMDIEYGMQGIIYSNTSPSASVLALQRDTLHITGNGSAFVPQDTGSYTMNYSLYMSSTDQNDINNYAQYEFQITENTFARDNGDTLDAGNVSWQMWSNGGNDGDRLCVTYPISSPTKISKMSFYCDPETDPGVQIIAYLVKSNELTGDWDQILSSGLYTIAASDTSRWVEMNFLLDGVSEYVDAGYYMVAIETYYNGLEFWIGEDMDTEQESWVTRWYNPNDQEYYWYTNYSYTPMIRLFTEDAAQNTVGESFEDSFFPPNGWTTIDDDGDGFGWQQSISGFNAQEGLYCATSASWDPAAQSPLTPDNWLITPQLAVSAGDSVSWWVQPQDPLWPSEKYAVLVSTTGNSISNFINTIHVETLDTTTTDWNYHAYDLSSYAGTNIFIAFRHYDCTDNFYLNIDNVKLPAFASGMISLSSSIFDINCFGGNDGYIDISVSGGTQPYSYVWSNGSYSEDQYNLSAGNYSVTVTDNLGVSTIGSFTLSQPDQLLISGVVSGVSGSGSSDGAIYLSVSGGTPPYSFLWSNGSYSQDLTNIPEGAYTVYVNDNNFCNAIELFIVGVNTCNSIPYFEDFETGVLPSDWSQETYATDGGWLVGNSIAMSSSYFEIPDHTTFICTNDDECNCDKSNDFLKTGCFDFSGSSTVVLEFDYFYYAASYSGATETCTLRISVDAGLTWTDLDYLSASDWEKYEIDLSAYAGYSNVMIGWLYNDGGGWLYGFAMDNLKLYEPLSYDVSIQEIIAPNYIATGSYDLNVVFKNEGITPISNLTLNYQLNSGTIHTSYNYGFYTSLFEVDTVLHSTPMYFANSGNYTITAWLSYPNGYQDQNPMNDTMTFDIQVIDSVANRLVLIEHFTQASCGPCASQNPALDALITDPLNIDRVTHIAYHTSWPGTDPMYDFNNLNGLGDARVGYYGIGGVPHCIVAGNQASGLPSVVDQAGIDIEYNRAGLANFTGTVNFENSSDNLYIDLTLTPYIDFTGGDFTAHVILVEDVDYIIAPGSNGETFFPDVMRMMFPGESGTDVNGKLAFQTVDLDFTYNVPSDIDISYCNVVVFVQNNTDKNIIVAQEFDIGTQLFIPLSAAFEANTTFGLAPLTVDFTDLSTGIPTSWLWDFGDGNTSTLQNPTHIYQSTGEYSVSLTVSNLLNSDNVTYVNYIKVVSQIIPKFPLHEVFTSSTCPPCVAGNDSLDNLLSHYPNQYALIKYQMNWPGTGDPYFINAGNTRRYFYNIAGVPHMHINGQSDMHPINYTDSLFQYHQSEISDIEILSNYSISGSELSIDVVLNPVANISPAAKLQIAVVEKLTTGNVGSNGQTEFHNVCHAMMNEGYGMAVNLQSGVQFTHNELIDMASTNVEEMSDLSVIVFVQDTVTMEVLQSSVSEEGSNLPNPGWTWTNTGVNHTVLVPNTIPMTIDGVQIDVGDYIGVFYDSAGVQACGGYLIWQNTTDAIVVWGDDSQTTAKDGFATGEEFQWKIFDASENMVYDVEAEYDMVSWPNTAYFATNGISGLTSLTYESTASNTWSYTLTGINHSILIPTNADITINGNPVQPGDLIGVFYVDDNGELACGGYQVYSGINTAVTAWGDDTQTSDKDGFGTGESFKWKIWSTSEGMEYPAVATYQTMFYNQGEFAANGISGLASLTASLSQEIELLQGWNMISTYIDPFEPLMDSLFSDISANVEIVKDNLGEVFWPAWNVNLIGNHEVGQGYQVRMINTDTLLITGMMVLPEQTPINLPAGWNMIAYLRQAAAPIEIMMQTISTDIELVKNNWGQIYWPAWNVNLLGDMLPGQGYQMRMINANILTYPANSQLFSKSKIGNTIINHQIRNTGSNMSLMIPKHVWDIKPDLEAELMIYSQSGLLLGSAIYSGGNTAITIWGDDETTPEVDGLLDGEKFILEIENQSFEITSWIKGDDNFEKNKIAVAGSILSSKNQNQAVLYQNIPNPFSNQTTISYYLPKDTEIELSVYNVLGEKIEVLESGAKPSGLHSVVYSAENQASGIYYLKLSVEGESVLKRMDFVK